MSKWISVDEELPERYEVKLCDTCIYGDKYEFEKPCVLYSDDCKLYEEKKMDDMTRAEAIKHLEFMVKSYQNLIDNDVRSGDAIGKDFEGEWKTEQTLADIYRTMIASLNIAINSLQIDEQYDLAMEQAELTGPTGHCKDCKYFEYDSVAKVDGMPLIVAHEICTKWGDGCKSKEDGYCFLFEPRKKGEDI